jgi:hypothetical protein
VIPDTRKPIAAGVTSRIAGLAGSAYRPPMFSLLLLALAVDLPADHPRDFLPCSRATRGAVCREDRPRSAFEDKRVLDGLVWDSVRVGTGASADVYFTAYCAHANPRCAEKNPLGFNTTARIALKTGTGIGIVVGAHELRKRGRHRWASWLTRGALAFQLGLALNNYWQAGRGGAFDAAPR